MKAIVKPTGFLSGRLLIMAFFVLILISCSKSDNSSAMTNATLSYCKAISWTDTDGRTGTFIGTLENGHYELTSVSYKEPLTTGGSVIFSYDASGHLMNQTGLTVTYNQDTLEKFVADLSLVSKATGTATYTFDSNGYLTNISAVGSDDNGPLSYTVAYTYDSNGDPVHVVGHGSQTTSQGISIDDYDVTATYLTDKGSLIPFIPIAAPFTAYFAFANCLSKHLINNWIIKENISVAGISQPELDFTFQYTYTYDTDGKVSTMVHTGNPNNIYTFTYTGCN
jgi:hypothetical protein